ncbi:MAG: hypothetical protein JWM80_413 [Cyanobacteria bacterium RYN_339]|nr:hypothetical protein [Cyanobacteria bacterium RYN_339]
MSLAAIVVMAGAPAILGTIPPYPGASRPLPTLETKTRAIAITSDKPEVVAAYYISRLTAIGWIPEPEVPHELKGARVGAPVWLTFTRRPGGKIDLQITTGLHPKTHKPVTLITYTWDPKAPENEP